MLVTEYCIPLFHNVDMYLKDKPIIDNRLTMAAITFSVTDYFLMF